MEDGFVLADCSVTKHKNAFGELGDVVFVRDENDGQPLIVEVLEDFHDFNGSAAIEIPGRLVREQDRRTVHESTRNGHALLLAAGHL